MFMRGLVSLNKTNFTSTAVHYVMWKHVKEAQVTITVKLFLNMKQKL
jgi:hypothetical protein